MSNPPPEVAAAASVVENWLKSAPQGRVSDEQYKAMSPAEKLNYTRQFTQKLADGIRQDHATMPEWKDPR
jgi:hypothetical protein